MWCKVNSIVVSGGVTHLEARMGPDPRCNRFGFYLFIGAVLLAVLAHDKSYVSAQVSDSSGLIVRILFELLFSGTRNQELRRRNLR